MNAKPTGNSSSGLGLGDVYHVFFRHKWKIIILSAAGIIASLALPRVWPKIYVSQAKILIQYVLQSRAPAKPDGGADRIPVSNDGQSIIRTEMEILKSLDLAREVATNITPEKILGKNGGSDPDAAADVIRDGLSVDVPDKSDVIYITFKHADPQLVQPVLAEVIRAYLERHADIHLRAGKFDDFLTRETDQLRSRLASTEGSLRSIKTNLNIVSIDDSRKAFGEQAARIQQSLFDAEAELAEHRAIISQLSTLVHKSEMSADATVTPTPVSEDKIAEYKRDCEMLDSLREKDRSLRLQYLPENALVKEVQDQINSIRKHKQQLEEEQPALLAVATPAQKTGSGSDSTIQMNILTENARIAALESKVRVWTNQLAIIRERAAAVDANEGSITDLERTRKLEEGYYTYFSANLAQSRIDAELGPGKASNISTIQDPSPPFRDTGKMAKFRKMLGLGGIAAGIALAFLIEMFLDRSLKRPAEIETRLGVPLFLSIPYRNGKSKVRLLEAPKKGVIVRSELFGRSVSLGAAKITIGRLPSNTLSLNEESVSEHHCEIFPQNGHFVVKDLGSNSGTFVDGERVAETIVKAGQTLRLGNVELRVETDGSDQGAVLSKQAVTAIAPWDPCHVLRPFYDALRDRLITYFEVKNLTHKPKLVALTSCNEGAGVTTVAAGLAAALSETGDGNVLLVEMNGQQGAAHYFHKGHLSCGLDEALHLGKRHEAMVQENLYVVTEKVGVNSLPNVLPKRFTHLVPKLKASDYDYIIFDMPPMSQISITPRLARFMDIIMMVVESERTDRDVVQRAVTMLTDAQANVGVVLNKQKTYVPRQILQEF